MQPQKIETSWGGHKLNSPRPQRRQLYFTIQPEYSDYIVDIINDFISKSTETRLTDTAIDTTPCKYCQIRRDMRKDFITSLNAWKEAYCLRHGAILFLNYVHVIANKLRYLEFSDNTVEYYTESGKHAALYTIYPTHATVGYTFTDREIKFTYRNYGPSSSYMLLRSLIAKHMSTVKDILTCNSRCANVYVNGKLICEASEFSGYCP